MMKKSISILLTITIILCLWGCRNGNSGQTDAAPTAEKAPFSVGYAKVSITPDYSIPLRGYGNPLKRMSTGYLDYIYATCAAITDEDGNTVVVYGIDLTNAFANCFPDYREKVASALNIPVDNVHMSCSHMHAGCDMTLTSNSSVSRYIQDMEKWLLKAAELAMADRKPATMQYASTNTEAMNFVRRYYRTDGTPAGDNYGLFSDAPIERHETEVDNQLQLLKFVREDGNDIIMANFQCHPHRASSSSSTDITADIVGVFRTELENQLGVDVLYFSGPSGNVNTKSRITSENITSDYKEHGKALAQYAINLEGKYIDVPTGKVRTTAIEFTGNADHSQDHKLEAAKQVQAWEDAGYTLDQCKDYMQEHGINSFHAAGAIISKANAPATRTTGLWAFAVGDIGFAVIPFEMFDTTGMCIKENSPFTATFLLTCANTHNTYLPSALAFENGGYEVDQSKFAAGTAEIIAEEYVAMLTTLK